MEGSVGGVARWPIGEVAVQQGLLRRLHVGDERKGGGGVDVEGGVGEQAMAVFEWSLWRRLGSRAVAVSSLSSLTNVLPEQARCGLDVLA